MELTRESRIREKDFLRFEIDEIEAAGIRESEEEELTALYRRISHSRRIAENLSAVQQALEGTGCPGRFREVDQACAYDESLNGNRDQLYDAESILSDAGRETAAYLEHMELDEERFREVEERLDLIHGLQAKYGNTVEAIFRKLEEKKQRLDELENFEERKAGAEQELKKTGRSWKPSAASCPR